MQSPEMEGTEVIAGLLGQLLLEKQTFWIIHLLEGIYFFIIKGNLSWEFVFL